MRLYLVRHGEAVSSGGEGGRALSDTGRQQVERVARQAAAAGVRPHEVRHSGKLRAQQTAEILAQNLRVVRTPQFLRGLLPDDDPRPVADFAASAQGEQMLVGHMPYLGRLASLLLCGEPERDLIRFEPATMACLERGSPGSRWLLRWVISPETAGP
jgi:phosphohistidine phosphatase